VFPEGKQVLTIE